MLRSLALVLLLPLIPQLPVCAQVKPQHLYNTGMPYGTLDIRTEISPTAYYYLEEGRTFSFRESAPGKRTNMYHDMTSWDSSPYKQGNMRRKDGEVDNFVMNYRVLHPSNYVAAHEGGYPMIVLMHGAVERGNCYYEKCYHGDWSYNPNTNVPPAPTDGNHKLLNNDHHLIHGGEQHLAARDLAGSRLPGDATMPQRAFPGFVLIPQMLNDWDSLAVEDMIRQVRLHCKKYNIDQNRIYIHGLSIGGYATYEAIKRAPWLFAAALPMSAVTEAANIFKHNLQGEVAHIPLWIFQGAVDKRPSRDFTKALMKKFRSAGAVMRYSVYPGTDHIVWDTAYNEPEFFSWMLGKSKADIHVWGGVPQIDTLNDRSAKLMLANGFLSYQWEKDGKIIPGAVNNILTVDAPGVYRARFSRMSETPAANEWNDWSPPVTVVEGGPIMGVEDEGALGISVYPNPTNGRDINIQLSPSSKGDVSVQLVDMLGQLVYEGTHFAGGLSDSHVVSLSLQLQDGIYIVIATNGRQEQRRRLVVSR
jgi:hypothetical protein